MAAFAEPHIERSRRWRVAIATPQATSLLILLIVLVGFSLANPNFLSPLNLSNMLAFLPELGIMALAMTLLLTAGEFDLSVGAVFALGPLLVMLLVQQTGMDIGPALLVGLFVCVAIGVINGLIVTKIGISSFLVTLSMLLIVRGTALYVTQGFPLKPWDQPSVFVAMLAGSFTVGSFKLYVSLFWFLGLIALFAYILNWSKLGNWISAIGSNRNAALARGVPADAVKIGLFVTAAALSGLAGMISAFRISSASPVAGTGYELEVIAMVVVGGTALNGGYGTILGTVVGAVMLRAIRNGIVLIGVPGLAFNIFVGAIILTMLILHAMLQKRGGPR
jgi:simple sugar transport system permease protein